QTIEALYREPGFSSRIHSKSVTLDDRCITQVDACITAVEAIPRPFVDAVTNATPAIQAAYDACKIYKGTWNTDATSALGATLRPSDNDGD
ncbi:MAG: hypothetical protein H7Z43_10625, partial [Clostridia bacterium]|nr:hypothetical protein [Deltaproteobacteria bacterium]